ncbi:MAG: cytochrome c biogenesis protein CcsA, partial [SAR324 cluster bacterium]|nr:cytochrome c biogenesis protein CcsA [SAR324 cluster bacterium]
GYLFSWGFRLSQSLNNNSKLLRWSEKTFFVFWLLHAVTLIIGLWWWEASWPTMFISDVLSFVAWLSIGGLIWFHVQISKLLQVEILPIFAVLILILSISIAQDGIPALALRNQEPWIYQTALLTHIISTIGGYTFFSLACLASSLFVYQNYRLKTKLEGVLRLRIPALGTLEKTSYVAIKWGFLLLSIGVVLGVMLSKSILIGETSWRLLLSVGVWFVYAMFLLDYHLHRIRSRLSQYWPIIGFALILAAVFVEAYHLSRPGILQN